MVQPNPARADPRPAELCLLIEPFGEQARPGSIPPYDLHPVGAFGSEDVESAAEGVGSRIPHQRHQAVNAATEVHRRRRHKDLNTGRDHAERTARRTMAR